MGATAAGNVRNGSGYAGRRRDLCSAHAGKGEQTSFCRVSVTEQKKGGEEMAKILIIDDSRTSRKIMRNLLSENGYDVVEAENGADGVEKYKTEQPKLVTMDITMPVIDGLEALRQIREYDGKANVIMVTAAGQESKVMEAVKLGAAEFITKPLEKDKILETVGKILGD